MADEEDFSVDEPQVDPQQQVNAAVALNELAKREESQLPSTLPTQVAPPPQVTAAQTMAFQPRTMPDLTRAPGVPSPAPDPSRLAPVTFMGPQPAPEQPDPRAQASMMQFEAQKGYQRDMDTMLRSGTDPQKAQAIAMAKYGPAMFSGSTGSGRTATAPWQQSQPKVVKGPNGQFFEVQGTSVVELRPPNSQTDKSERAIAIQDRASLNKRIGNLQAMVDSDPTSANATEWRRQLVKLGVEKQALDAMLRPKPVGSVQVANPTTGTTAASPPKDRVSRAESLRQQHPDWSKAQIIAQVKKELP